MGLEATCRARPGDGVSPAEVAIVGAGPAASSLLERIAASASEILDGQPLRVHLIDPHRAGTGRVWRSDNHPGLWMNSLAEDVTMFTDDSVVCDGPIRPGPSLYEWARSVDASTLADLPLPAPLSNEILSLTGTSFPTRRVQSAYLEWFHRNLLASLPPEVEVIVHSAKAVDVRDDGDGRQSVHLEGGAAPLVVDAVVLALGHLDSQPDAQSAGLTAFAEQHGLIHVPPGHTAELDFSAIEPGADVIALGFGQAFTDLVVLLTEGRGGSFVDNHDGTLRYEASGREPVIHVGSRRGVPYRSKIDYRLQAARAPLPTFLDEAAIETLLARDGTLDFRRDVLPLVLKEVGWAYYHELFNAHPERTTISWDEFARRYKASADSTEIDQLIAASVRDRNDVFDLDRLNTPLAGLRFESAAALHQHVRGHIADDVERRTDAAFSADLGAFYALLQTFGTIARIGATSRLSTRSRVEDVNRWWFSFFMYYASGPPPARLRQLLALEAAGLVRFIGAHTTVRADHPRGLFVATSASHPDEIFAGVLVEATVAGASLTRTTDILLQHLRDRGEVIEEVVTDDDGWQANTGKVVVGGPALNLVGADGRLHPLRHGIGAFTSRPAAGAFSRPNTNAPAFRQHDVVARSILETLARHRASAPTSSVRPRLHDSSGLTTPFPVPTPPAARL